MASKAVNPILEGLASIVTATLAAKLADPLQKIYERNPKKFGLKCKGALLLLEELADLTTKTDTKIDDAAVSSLVDVIKASAAANKVKL